MTTATQSLRGVADGPHTTRRRLLMRGTSVAMATGMLAGYGTCASVGARYLYPRASERVRLFITELSAIAPGESMRWVTPAGAKIAVTRLSDRGTADDFIALSSTCPHLGCQVHWEADKQRFFCPCHNGTFDPSGNPTGGPPKSAGTALVRYPLLVEAGLLFVEIPKRELS